MSIPEVRFGSPLQAGNARIAESTDSLGNNRSRFQSKLPGRDAQRRRPEVSFWEVWACNLVLRLVQRAGPVPRPLQRGILHCLQWEQWGLQTPSSVKPYPPTFAVFSRVFRKVSYVRVESGRTIIGIGGRLPQSCYFQRLQNKCVPCEHTVVTEERMPGVRRKVFVAGGKVVRDIKFRP